jgi:diguanylate cyclase (GGDEF)-like protein
MIENIKTALAINTGIQEDPFLHRRVIMTTALLVVATLTFALFTFINFNSKILSLINFVCSLSSALALYALIVKKSFNFSAYFATILLFAFIVTFTYFTQNDSFALVWTLCYPLFVIPILGVRKGTIVLFLFYAAIIPMAYLGIGVWDYGFWDLKAFVRFMIVSGLVVYATYFSEISAISAYKTIQIIREKEKTHLIRLENLSVTDELTGLHNRRYFDKHFEIELQKIKRNKKELCLVMVDIDHFKRINDVHGHQVGDEVLKEFSTLLENNIRTTDLVSRWGGEEFIILLPETSIENSVNLAEKIRVIISHYDFSKVGNISASFGVSIVDPNSNSNRGPLHEVDEALYLAKDQGRNRVVAHKGKND